MTKDQFEAWQGSDNLNINSLIQLLLDLANKTYALDEFIKDVAEYDDN